MSLRVAQRGYRYQDFIAGRIVLDEMLKDGNPTIQVDKKDEKDDFVDDIKVIENNNKIKIQTS